MSFTNKIPFFFICIFLFISCSKESEINTFEENLENKSRSDEVNPLIIDYYDDDFSIGESITISEENIKFTALNSSKQRSPIGYMIEELSSNDLVALIDVNLNTNKVTVIDNIEDRTAVSNNFFKDNNIDNSDDFNLLNLIDEELNNESENRRPFWGTECHAGSCSTCIECCYYIVWIQVACFDMNFAL